MNKKTITISVVIPCFNAADSIQATIKSVLSQTYSPEHLIVIDDGSTDNTALIVWGMVDEIKAANIKLTVISQQNSGVSNARNKGILESTSDVVAFLDADDTWRMNKLEQHAIAFIDEDLGISFARCAIHNKEKQKTVISSLPMGQQTLSSVFAENPTTTTSNLVIRTTLLKQINGFDETMSFAEDQELIARSIAQTNYKVSGIDKVLVDYETNEDGLSSQLNKMYLGWQKMAKKVAHYAPDFVEKEYAEAHARYCMYLARRNLRLNKNPKEGWTFTQKALRTDWRIIIKQPLRSIPVISLNLLRRYIPIAIH